MPLHEVCVSLSLYLLCTVNNAVHTSSNAGTGHTIFHRHFPILFKKGIKIFLKNGYTKKIEPKNKNKPAKTHLASASFLSMHETKTSRTCSVAAAVAAANTVTAVLTRTAVTCFSAADPNAAAVLT